MSSEIKEIKNHFGKPRTENILVFSIYQEVSQNIIPDAKTSEAFSQSQKQHIFSYHCYSSKLYRKYTSQSNEENT